jgi:hypothetical protein
MAVTKNEEEFFVAGVATALRILDIAPVVKKMPSANGGRSLVFFESWHRMFHPFPEKLPPHN